MKPKITVLIILAVLLMTALAVGFSFALWTSNNQQANSNTVLSGCLSINYTETAGSLINLQNHYPISDEMGSSTDPYTFTVTNTCTTYASYQVNVESLSTSTVSPTFVRVMLDNNQSNTLNTFSNVEETNAGATAFNLKTLELAPNESVTHNFRMWIDKAATQSDVANKKIDIKVSVIASAILPPYTDPVLAGSDPVLDSKMIPVNIADSGVVTVAAASEEWYNYAESKWANAVIVDPTFTTLDPGTTIPMESIEQMYVWIPRYEYKKSSIVNAQESIEINFVPISTVNTDIENNDVIVHPAFTFGGVEQNGLWVGKFESGILNFGDDYVTDIDYVIKPNVNSAHVLNISSMYNNINRAMTTYDLDSVTDVHMIKNTEWGAVAYLSQSQYGICDDEITCSEKVENNNFAFGFSVEFGFDIVTGCGGDDVYNSVNYGSEICPLENRWETVNGIKASTTHNITGIYDMAGGRSEYVMGNIQDSGGDFYSASAGFTTVPDAKYYDSYAYGTSNTDYTSGLYGDATLELNPSGILMSEWSSDQAYFVSLNQAWFMRGGTAADEEEAGIWAFEGSIGQSAEVSYMGQAHNISTRATIAFN